jgi:hypothetical protein
MGKAMDMSGQEVYVGNLRSFLSISTSFKAYEKQRVKKEI